MKYVFIIFCLQLLFPAGAFLQSEEWDSQEYMEEQDLPRRYSFFSLDFDWNIPVGSQRDYLKKHNLGIGARYLYQVKPELPLFAGVSMFYGGYDKSSYEFYDFSEVGESLFSETAECTIFNVNLDLRYFPGLGFWIFEPFVGSSIGMSNSMIITSLYNVDLAETYSIDVEESSWKPVYLFETGTLIKFEKDMDEIFGHFTIGYAAGVNNKFSLKKPDYNPSQRPINHFDRKKIPFQMMKMNFGVIAYF
jgi:hypothetical protein